MLTVFMKHRLADEAWIYYLLAFLSTVILPGPGGWLRQRLLVQRARGRQQHQPRVAACALAAKDGRPLGCVKMWIYMSGKLT
jgi:hypothetical protein